VIGARPWLNVCRRAPARTPGQGCAGERWRVIVGANVRTIRLANDMTQELLAVRSGVTRNVLADVEHGRRGLLYERLFDIADALDVESEELLKRPERRRRR
jgi:transcriptional regulator with XRE-family HTH domain